MEKYFVNDSSQSFGLLAFTTARVILKKTQLYNHLWEAANALRGGMDTSQYKDYVLTILFVRHWDKIIPRLSQ